MSERHRILIVDDSAQDRQAVVNALRRAAEIDGVEADALEVDTVGAAREALQHEEFSCVFLDHDLPDGTALDLLMEVRAQGLITPVVVLTGQRDEQTVAEVMRAGAVDYLPKERLHPDLVARSLRAALLFHQAQRDKQAALDELRARDRAIAAAPSGIVIADPRQPDCPLVYVNEAFTRMTGYTQEEALGRNCRFLQGSGTDPVAVMELRAAVREQRGCQVLILNHRKDGTPFWNEVTVSPVRDAKGVLTHFIGVQTDVTARHMAEEERQAAQQALQDAHANTAAILASITDSFFTLDTDWRFTYVNDQADRLMSLRREQVMGRNFWDLFPHLVGSVFDEQYRRAIAEQAPISFETFYPTLDAWLEVRAYPSPHGLSVFFQNVSERKAIEAERERLAERERNIAQQLQAALTPTIPDHIPGLALTKYYEAALEEAGVGGDFYDVFPMDKGCTALVVGDLAGKGLAAASQVATVRNMLRYALYRARTVAGAVEGLNELLAEQGLLTGFATLFVGMVDSGSGTLAYVNCGQEPALVRRASGTVERLVPTGPVLGSFEGAAFEQKTIALERGDALAIFTDGLTEVGRSRREMLGVDGVADLLTGIVVPDEADSAEAVAEYITLQLIAGVDEAAQGGVMRDDVCLLIAVVESGSG